MKFNEKNSFLRVIKALPGDRGKGVARIPLEDMTRLGTALGDVVEIKGEQSTVAKVVPLPQEYQKERVIQIDGTIRRNAYAISRSSLLIFERQHTIKIWQNV